MKYVLMVSALLFSFNGFGQPVLTVDRTELRIGDQVKASIRVDINHGQWINVNNPWPDSLTGIEVVSGPELDESDPSNYSATWTLAVFDTGWVRIPALPVFISSQGKTDTLYTNDVPLKVSVVEPDSTGLVGLKEIYLEPFNPGYYKKYIPHILGFLLLVVLLALWLKQRKSRKVIVEPVQVPLLPHEWALNELGMLEENKLWQRGEVKEHYSKLTAILREYLERRYSIHAMEQTSEEILIQLQRLQLEPALLADTAELLSIADLIKFAKADPGMSIHNVAIQRVRTFVQATIPSIHLTQEENLKSGTEDVLE